MKLETPNPSTSWILKFAFASARPTASAMTDEVLVPGTGYRVYGDSPVPTMDAELLNVLPSLQFSVRSEPGSQRLEEVVGAERLLDDSDFDHQIDNRLNIVCVPFRDELRQIHVAGRFRVHVGVFRHDL